MKKNVYILAAVTVLMIASVSGCKKKEDVDLTGIHTSSAETMSPTTAAENEKKEPEITITESSTAAEKGGDKDNTGSSQALSVRSKTATEKNGKTSVEYPVLSNLRDSAMEETVNAVIKEHALRPLTDYELNPETDTLEVTYSIISLDRNKAVIAYEGSFMLDGGAHPVGLFYTTNIDLNKGTLTGLSDYADSYTMAGYILSDDCVVYQPADSSPEVKAALKEYDIDTLWAILRQCDFSAEGLTGFPQSFSYENQGVIYISVPVSHALGDYVIVSYTPDTK
ncbi:DUF4163 domain-containing protein [bacterium 1XD42-94]|nr:DUF4163 domain-containing protein [bacterium 1XD42-76]NBK06816.1 DUF4163 domain-containing protein [bacterium 1XD42-94]